MSILVFDKPLKSICFDHLVSGASFLASYLESNSHLSLFLCSLIVFLLYHTWTYFREFVHAWVNFSPSLLSFGDVAYNTRRNFLGAMCARGKIA